MLPDGLATATQTRDRGVSECYRSFRQLTDQSARILSTCVTVDPQLQSPTDSSDVPAGVGGWLLALCLILTIVFPATSLYRIISHTIPTAIAAHTLNPILLLSVYSLLFSDLAVASFVAGLRLWLVIVKPHAVGFARRFLLTYLIGNAAYFVLWIAVVRPTKQVAYAEMGWYHLVGPAAFVYLWHTYLEHSKRVRRTYPVAIAGSVRSLDNRGVARSAAD